MESFGYRKMAPTRASALHPLRETGNQNQCPDALTLTLGIGDFRVRLSAVYREVFSIVSLPRGFPISWSKSS